MVTVIKVTFDITTSTEVITGVTGKKHYIVAFSVFNNDTSSREICELATLNPTTYLYGGDNQGIFLKKNGGNFTLPIQVYPHSNKLIPWFETNTGSGFWITPVSSKRLSGEIIYYTE